MKETYLARDELLVLLGAKKDHVKTNIMDYLKILKKEVFVNKGAIVDDLIRGIGKLKEAKLFKSAYEDFKSAIRRELTQENWNPMLALKDDDVFERCRLFAEIMKISYTNNFNEKGPCLRNLGRAEKIDTVHYQLGN